MKRFNFVTIFLITVAVLALGLIVWKFVDRNNRSDVNTPGLPSQSSNDCGGDRQCFYQAFSDGCTQKTIKTTVSTIEGDPILTTAKIAQGSAGCRIEVTVDTSKDKYGEGKMRTYTCERLALESSYLVASECTGNTQNSSVDI